MGSPFVFLMLNFIVLTGMLRQNIMHKTECNFPNPYTVATITVFIRNIVVLKAKKKFYVLPHIWNLGVLTTIAYLLDLSRLTLLRCKTSDFITSSLTAMFIVAISLRNPFEEMISTLSDLNKKCQGDNSDTSSGNTNVRKLRVLKEVPNIFEESSSDFSRACSNNRSTQTSQRCVSKCCQHSFHQIQPPISQARQRRKGDGDSKPAKKRPLEVEVQEHKSIVVQRIKVEQSGDFEVIPMPKPQPNATRRSFIVPRRERTTSAVRSVDNDIINMDDLINATETIESDFNPLETIFITDKDLIELSKVTTGFTTNVSTTTTKCTLQ